MTRLELTTYVDALRAASASQGVRAEVDVRPGASAEELRRCEETLAVRIPEAYRQSLSEWNGCAIRLFARQRVASEALQADFTILDTSRIEVVTKSLRRSIDMVMMGSAHADALRNMMLSVVAITDHDDITALLSADPNRLDISVRIVDLEYIASESIDDVVAVAASPDEYIAKCLGHLTKTLKTEIYWW